MPSLLGMTCVTSVTGNVVSPDRARLLFIRRLAMHLGRAAAFYGLQLSRRGHLYTTDMFTDILVVYFMGLHAFSQQVDVLTNRIHSRTNVWF
jgi:hypothetical protein